MCHHGSKRFRNAGIHYRPQDLKLINTIWREILGTDFIPDSKTHIDERIKSALDPEIYTDVCAKLKEVPVHYDTFYVQSTGKITAIPKELRNLRLLVAAKKNYSISPNEKRIYVGNVN